MNKCIIISGKSGHGKDMLAHFMRERLEEEGLCVLTIHYGDAVKWVLRDFFNWDGQKDEKGRTLLQHIGTDVVRAKYPNFWTTIVAGLVSSFENEFDVVLIPDARFPNEVEIVMDMVPNTICARIERKNPDGSMWLNPAFTEAQLKHPSETSLDNYGFDYIIHNDEGLDVLKESAITLLTDLGLIKEGENND